jgi:hypothetical protein
MIERAIIQKQRTAFEQGAEFGWNKADAGYGASTTHIQARAEAANRFPIPTRPRTVLSSEKLYTYRVFSGVAQWQYTDTPSPKTWYTLSAVPMKDFDIINDLLKNPTEEAI